MLMQAYLDQQIQKVCPIDGISFGDLNDKSTWIIHYQASATDAQKLAAQNLMTAFTWDALTQAKANLAERLINLAQDPAMKLGYVNYKQANPTAKFADFVAYLDTLTVS